MMNECRAAIQRSGLCCIDFLPGLVRIKHDYAFGDEVGPYSQILLVDSAAMIDQKGHDAGIAVLGRPGDQRKTTDHLALDDVVEGAAGRVRALPFQDSEIISVIRPRSTFGSLVPFG